MGEVRVQLHSFSTSALVKVRGQFHARAALPLGKTLPASTHWKVGWICYRAGRDILERRKNALVPNLNLIFRTVLSGTTPTRVPFWYADENSAGHVKVLVLAVSQLLSYPVLAIRNEPLTGAYPEVFTEKGVGRGGGRFDPETIDIFHVCFSKIILQKTCRKYKHKITLLPTAFIDIQI